MRTSGQRRPAIGIVKIVGNRPLLGVALAAVALVVSGCSTTKDNAPSSSGAGPSSAKVAALGPFFGECGGVTDQEVADAMGVTSFPIITRNSVGCVWEVGSLAAPHVSFSWYRGSPIGREAQGSGGIGRTPEKIEIEGHPGFKGYVAERLCEIGVQFGDDFIHWSVSYGGFTPAGDVCDSAKKLADLTVARAPK